MIIDRLFPIVSEFRAHAPMRKRATCARCGRCCALITIGASKTKLARQVAEWEAYYREHVRRGPIPRFVLDGRVVGKHWRRIYRAEAHARGVYVAPGKFAYSCELLRDDLTCSIHDSKPPLCAQYPSAYPKKLKAVDGVVHPECAFARKGRK